MNRRTSIRSLFAMAAALLGSVIALGHNGVEHVMGTVSAITENSITVETVKHTKVTVPVDAATTFTNKGVKVTPADLKVGERIVVNAKKNAGNKLQGISVKRGTGSNTTMSHADHKK